ncbi:RagB/SusD family nutrient uptake outer membrane protein [Chitinophagaceae bacterium LB-8]|uniref:RagB/SusD family nutrient uptake outer membrane protein n=1 Tax=Paraflavisolibacter caeni TaxID=2982496 RepID=A0A9X2XNG5_9BACT|nr:RagB/SusD family nutrient uptake outer membrane protein [Paraflavisolibacter caeni]MCU7548698.1 RagB/SusD family nutrient uptake outer membrane protein [Paraflavisolibacter caeni]
MKHNFIKILLVSAVVSFAGCKKYLDFEPKGTLTIDQLQTPDKVDALVTAAYAAIGNDFWDGSITSMWAYGSVRSDDAYKGGGSVGDVGEYNTYEQYNLVTPTTIGNANNTWTRAYGAISRANFALQQLEKLTTAEMSNKAVRQAEARFLRGHMHFFLKLLFKHIPYIDEKLSEAEILATSNRKYSNDQLWDKIAEDFQFAIDNLPETQSQVGRANKWAAKAYLAKVRLYQAYEQDENNNVTNINKNRLNEVVNLTTEIINSGKYSLQPDFAENFLFGFDNGPESIFAVQFSINDGTSIGRLSMATSLNYSLAPQYGCCWFHIPSQNMVNAFKTGSNGLPQFDSFNDVALTDADLTTNGAPVDPRIDHTVGIQGHPFKYNPNIRYDHSWERIAALYGSFGNMKEQQEATSPSFKKVGPFYGSAKNIDIIRYADVLLWKAEALIELGRQSEALPLINQIRARAKSSTQRTRLANGTAPSNYRIEDYKDGVNINWTQANARKALQWERRLEFAMESPRFFDLVRWGIAAETLNAYLAVEKTRRTYLSAAKFTKGRDEYFPIPQKEIDFTKGVYTQNPGY